MQQKKAELLKKKAELRQQLGALGQEIGKDAFHDMEGMIDKKVNGDDLTALEKIEKKILIVKTVITHSRQIKKDYMDLLMVMLSLNSDLAKSIETFTNIVDNAKTAATTIPASNDSAVVKNVGRRSGSLVSFVAGIASLRKVGNKKSTRDHGAGAGVEASAGVVEPSGDSKYSLPAPLFGGPQEGVSAIDKQALFSDIQYDDDEYDKSLEASSAPASAPAPAVSGQSLAAAAPAPAPAPAVSGQSSAAAALAPAPAAAVAAQGDLAAIDGRNYAKSLSYVNKGCGERLEAASAPAPDPASASSAQSSVSEAPAIQSTAPTAAQPLATAASQLEQDPLAVLRARLAEKKKGVPFPSFSKYDGPGQYRTPNETARVEKRRDKVLEELKATAEDRNAVSAPAPAPASAATAEEPASPAAPAPAPASPAPAPSAPPASAAQAHPPAPAQDPARSWEDYEKAITYGDSAATAPARPPAPAASDAPRAWGAPAPAPVMLAQSPAPAPAAHAIPSWVSVEKAASAWSRPKRDESGPTQPDQTPVGPQDQAAADSRRPSVADRVNMFGGGS